MNFFRLHTLLIFLLLFSGCASSTVIRSTDSKTNIYINGKLRGTGTAVYSDRSIVGTTQYVRLKKPGCEAKTYEMKRVGKVNMMACVSGVFLIVPFLWIFDYPSEHVYNYVCVKDPNDPTPYDPDEANEIDD